MTSGFMSSLRSFPPLGVAALLVATLGARGDEPPAVQADIGYASRYVFRGIERAGQSAQAGVELTRENFHTGLWLNQPLESNGTRETNLRMAYAGQPAKGLTLEASVTHSWFSDTPGGDVKRTLEAGLTAAVAAGNGFVPSVAYFHDFRLHANTTQVSLERSIALTKLGAFLELNFFAGWATGDNWRPDTPGPQRHDSYGYWGGEARLPYRIGPHSTVTAGLHYADATGRSATNGPFGLAARQNLWATLGVNLDF
jgi:hypothetical protein